MIPRLLLRLLGWTVDERFPADRKYVVIAAPHTSTWDGPLGLLTIWAMEPRFCFVAKHTLFWWPLGAILRAVGGISIDRRFRSNFVGQMVDLIERREAIAFALMPEGTRRRTDYWKSGFYHLALGAGVPIVFGYLDYWRKRIGVGGSFTPTGNEDADMRIIRDFYQDKQGRHPQKQGPIRLKPRD